MMEPQQTNGYRVIFGFPGAIMQKDNLAHRDGRGRRGGERLVPFKIESAFKFSLKCDDHMVTTLGVNPLTPIGPTHHRLKLN